jgi:hypothetical protein
MNQPAGQPKLQGWPAELQSMIESYRPDERFISGARIDKQRKIENVP